MYKAEPLLKQRLTNNIQTRHNNNDPRPLVYITRNKTAITSQKYWERSIISPSPGSRSTIAVRRPEGHLTGDMIYSCQIFNGVASVKYAQTRSSLKDMVWEIFMNIQNVTEVSMVFDGMMKKVDEKVESYTLGKAPYIFFVDYGGTLKVRNLDNPTIDDLSISNNVTTVSCVRGLYSEAANLNDGIWVFYTNTSGELWEIRFLNGEVVEQTRINLYPMGVSSWVDVWASMTWDYRIILQLKGNNGKVYTLLGSSRPYGFSFLEYVGISKIKLTGKLGLLPPDPVSSENTYALGSWSKCIKIKFDGKVHNVSSDLTDYFRILDVYGTPHYPINVTYGSSERELHIWFTDFRRCVQPLRIEYLGGTDFGGVDFAMNAFVLPIFISNVKPSDENEYLRMNVSMAGEFLELLDLKGQTNEAVRISKLKLDGEFKEVDFEGVTGNEALVVSNITLTGQFKNIDEGGV